MVGWKNRRRVGRVDLAGTVAGVSRLLRRQWQMWGVRWETTTVCVPIADSTAPALAPLVPPPPAVVVVTRVGQERQGGQGWASRRGSWEGWDREGTGTTITRFKPVGHWGNRWKKRNRVTFSTTFRRPPFTPEPKSETTSELPTQATSGAGARAAFISGKRSNSVHRWR